jgi:hypothetical protein
MSTQEVPVLMYSTLVPLHMSRYSVSTDLLIMAVPRLRRFHTAYKPSTSALRAQFSSYSVDYSKQYSVVKAASRISERKSISLLRGNMI